MNKKKALAKISALSNNGYAALNEPEFNNYLSELNTFCNNMTAHEEAIKNSIKEADCALLIKILAEINESLKRICAQELADICSKMSNDFHEIVKTEVVPNRDELEEKMADFTRNLSALSIDIQMALIKDDDELGEGVTAATPSEADVMSGTRTYSILAVDDVSFFLHMLKMHLNNTPYEINCVNSGKLALRYLKDNKADLFILDIDMPEMDGFELAENIRSRGFNQPILFLTANANIKSVIRAIEAGGTDFVVKPCNKEQLISRISRYCP